MRITVSSFVRSKLVGEQVVSITLAYVPLDLSLPDQPNRAVRTRMLRGVGGAPWEGRPYPDSILLFFRYYQHFKIFSC
jgi:hypothetical protein